MALEVTLDHIGFDKGVELEIPGLGVIPNGGTVTLTEDQERQFIIRNDVTVKDAAKDNGLFSVSGTAFIKDVDEGLDNQPKPKNKPASSTSSNDDN